MTSTFRDTEAWVPMEQSAGLGTTSFVQRLGSAFSGAVALGVIAFSAGTSLPPATAQGAGSYFASPTAAERRREHFGSTETENNFAFTDLPNAEHADAPFKPTAISPLRPFLSKVFGDAEVETEVHLDPDEGWTKTVVIVHTGVQDFDEQFALEEEFFRQTGQVPELESVLADIILVQV